MLEIGPAPAEPAAGKPAGPAYSPSNGIGIEQQRAAAIRQRRSHRSTAGGFTCRAVLLVLPAALALAGCVSTPQPGITDSDSPSQALPAQPSSPGTSAPLETSQASNKAPVYWIGRSNDNTFLYREFRDVPEEDNPVTRALRVMMSEKPLDPDFFTPWQNPKKLASSISGKNVITVDLSADAFNSNVDPAMAERAVQQLVYTASAAAASAGLIDAGQQIQVVVLVDGHTDYVAFNHVRLGSPTSRSAGMVAPVWIIDPQEGTSLADGAVKISGRSTAPGGKLRWDILRVDGSAKTSYLNGMLTTSAEAGQAGIFSLPVNLGPGNYEVRVSQVEDENPDQQLFADTRGFTVR